MTRARLDTEAPRRDHLFWDGVYWTLVVAALVASVFGYASSTRTLFFFGVISLAIGIYAGFIEPRWLRITRYRLPLVAHPSEWMTIAFLSDFHAGRYKSKRFFDRVARLTERENPHIVVIGGDAVDELTDRITDLSACKDIHPPQGKFFLFGNHDYLDDPNALAQMWRAWGYRDLTNRREMIQVHHRSLELVGWDDSWQGQPITDSATIAREKLIPRVLFVHEPDALLDILDGTADLIVMGHTHGGQVRLPWIGNLRRLPQEAPQTFDAGQKTWRGIPVIISRGLGETGVRTRLCCRPEIVMMEVGV